ncbi:MAG TPA: hypothetical protein PKU67_07020 [Candidatus Hydrothermia bacterium]|nr:hypothetical protein [Candidatus Hydrothermia bacterium]HOL24572.1 hypothetical protein [Candidatus Hydrothermia bacterium]
MQVVLNLLLSYYMCLPDLLDVRSLSLQQNFLVITSSTGIGIYDLNNRTLRTCFEVEDPDFGIMTPDLSRIYFIQGKYDLSYFDIPAGEKVLLRTLEFRPDIVGVGQKSIIIVHSYNEILLDPAGFELPASEKERNYTFPSRSGTLSYIPPIFNPFGEKVKVSAVLYDPLQNLYFVGTRNTGVYIFDNKRKIFVDSIKTGLPNDFPILDATCFNGNLWILTSNYLCAVRNDFASKLIYASILGSGEELTGIFNADSTLYIYTNQGKIFSVENERLIFEKNLGIPVKNLYRNNSGFLVETQSGILEVTADGDSTNIIRNYNINEIDRLRPLGCGFAFLLKGKLYVNHGDTLFIISDSTTLDQPVIDFETSGDTILALTFSHLLRISSASTKVIELPFNDPRRIFFDRENVFIWKWPFLATLSDGEDFSLETIQEVKEPVLKVLNFENRRVLVTSKRVWLRI